MIKDEGLKFSTVPVGERGLGEAIGIDGVWVTAFSPEETSLEVSFCVKMFFQRGLGFGSISQVWRSRKVGGGLHVLVACACCIFLETASIAFRWDCLVVLDDFLGLLKGKETLDF